MLELGGYPDLIEESLGADDRGQVRSQHFDRDLAAVSDVVCQVHGGHPAGTQLTFDAVAVG